MYPCSFSALAVGDIVTEKVLRTYCSIDKVVPKRGPAVNEGVEQAPLAGTNPVTYLVINDFEAVNPSDKIFLGKMKIPASPVALVAMVVV
jgi:hypothetical protein